MDGDHVTISSVYEFVEGWRHINQEVFKVTAMTGMSEKIANNIVDEFLVIKEEQKAKGLRGGGGFAKGRMEMKKRLIKAAVENVKAQRERDGLNMFGKDTVPSLVAMEVIKLKTSQRFNENDGPNGAPHIAKKFVKFRAAIETAMDNMGDCDEFDSDSFVNAIVSEVFRIKHHGRGPPHHHPHGNPPPHGHPHGHHPPHGPPHGHHPPHHGTDPFVPPGPPHNHHVHHLHGSRGDIHAWRMANWKGTVKLAVKRALGEAPPISNDPTPDTAPAAKKTTTTIDRNSDDSSFECVQSMGE